MMKRSLKVKIQQQLGKSATIAIFGPRQVGKTTLAKEIAVDISSTYIDLEDPRDIQKLDDPG